MDGSDDESFIASEYASVLTGKPGTFERKIYDKGYLNTLEIEYIGGIVRSGDYKGYAVTYKIPLEDHVFLIGFITDTKAELRPIFYMLNVMYGTMFRYGSADIPRGVSSNNVTVSSEGVVVTTPTIELYGARDYEDIDDVLTDKEADEYKLKYPDSTEIREQVTVAGNLTEQQVVFAFEYTYGFATPSYATLTSPSGETYSPDYINTENDARITFVIDKPEQGAWTIVVADDAEMGVYNVNVMEYMDYQDAINRMEVSEYDPDEENTDAVEVMDGRIIDPSTGNILYMTGE